MITLNYFDFIIYNIMIITISIFIFKELFPCNNHQI